MDYRRDWPVLLADTPKGSAFRHLLNASRANSEAIAMPPIAATEIGSHPGAAAGMRFSISNRRLYLFGSILHFHACMRR